jgi:hypothetical protein
MSADRRSAEYPAWVARLGRERRSQGDRRTGRDRRQADRAERFVLNNRRIGFDRRSLRERRSAAGARRSPASMRLPPGV